MPFRSITLTHPGAGTTQVIEWDIAAGVVRGDGVDDIARYGRDPWCFGPLAIGDDTHPALNSNDGMIALLLSLGYGMPPELEIEFPTAEDGSQWIA